MNLGEGCMPMLACCQCKQLSARISGPTEQIVACHCLDCQRRSGSPFGVIAYYPSSDIVLSGEARQYSRTSESGNRFTQGFGTVRISVCGRAVEHYAAMALMNRSPKMTANCALV